MTRAALNRHRTATLDPVPDPPEPTPDPLRPLLAWLLAGCALFTVVSGRTGSHVVVKVKRARRPHELSWSWYVWTRGGTQDPDGDGDDRSTREGGPWHYVGELHAWQGQFTVQPGIKVVPTQATQPHAERLLPVINWVLSQINMGWDGTGDTVPAQLLKSVRCARCRRVLTDPESIARGLGNECAQRQGAERD